MALAFGPVPKARSFLPTSRLCLYLHGWAFPRDVKEMTTHHLEFTFTTYNDVLSSTYTSMLGSSAIRDYGADREYVKALLIERGSPLTKGMQMSPLERKRRALHALLTGLRNAGPFDTIAQCLSALLAGLAGAMVAWCVYRESKQPVS